METWLKAAPDHFSAAHKLFIGNHLHLENFIFFFKEEKNHLQDGEADGAGDWIPAKCGEVSSQSFWHLPWELKRLKDALKRLVIYLEHITAPIG